MHFDPFTNWAAIEVLWVLFAAGGLGVGIWNLRQSLRENSVAERGTDEHVYAVGAIIRDVGRVVAQTLGVLFGLYAGLFNPAPPNVIGAVIFFVYIGSYTIGSIADAAVRYVLARPGR